MDADEQARQLLRAYGERSAPSPEMRDRAWSAIAAATAAPASGSAPASGNLVLKAALGVGAVVAIGLASWSWSRTSDDITDARPALPMLATQALGSGVAPTTEEDVSMPEEREVALRPTEPESARASDPSAATRSAAPSDRIVPGEVDIEPAAPTASGAPPAGTLAEELALMDRARQAIARGDESAALQALDEHDSRFPAGTLARERGVLRVTALCAAGRDDEAIATAAAAGPRPAITRALSRCGAP